MPAVLIVIRVFAPLENIVSVSVDEPPVKVTAVEVELGIDCVPLLARRQIGGTIPVPLRNEITSFVNTFQAAAVATSPAAST